MPDGTAVAVRKPTNFEIELANYEPQIQAALPAHIPLERFKRTVLTAINQNPDLIGADRRTLFLSCVRAAQDGLFPDGREAALVIFKMKDRQTDQWKSAVQYMPMVAGIIKRMRNSGELSAISAHVVYEKDHFDFQLGDEPRIDHKPALLDRGQPIGVYAIARLSNGEVQREVMSVAEINKVRAVSRAKDKGPWVEWWEEMARKTVIRRLSKRLPMSSDLDELMKRDDEAFYGQGDRAQGTVDLAPPKRPQRRDFAESPADREFREAVENGTAEDAVVEVINEETGEVTTEAVDLPQRDAAFWAADSYEIKPPSGARGKGIDWKGWRAAFDARLAEASAPGEVARLDHDNARHIGNYTLADKDGGADLRAAIAARAGELAAPADDFPGDRPAQVA